MRALRRWRTEVVTRRKLSQGWAKEASGLTRWKKDRSRHKYWWAYWGKDWKNGKYRFRKQDKIEAQSDKFEAIHFAAEDDEILNEWCDEVDISSEEIEAAMNTYSWEHSTHEGESVFTCRTSRLDRVCDFYPERNKLLVFSTVRGANGRLVEHLYEDELHCTSLEQAENLITEMLEAESSNT